MGKSGLSALVGAGILATTVLAGGAGAAKTKTFHFIETSTGAQISPTEAVFKIHDSRLGNGAGDQFVRLNGKTGTDTETTYYAYGTATSHGSFTLGAPDANGVATLTGQGQDTGGTGQLRRFRSKYTYTGTFNYQTLVFTLVIKGAGSTK